MPERESVVVLGGGLSGAACAYALARAGLGPVTLVERNAEIGGLALSFERGGHFYPLGYHHILHRDRVLLYFLERIGALASVRWRKIRMRFEVGGRSFDLARPLDFLRFPMSFLDKLRFVRLMLRAFDKADWSEWEERSARELIDEWASPGVREALFEKLMRLRFEMGCEELSAAWLGARLHFREGSAPLGYIPHANWTKVLCDGVARLLAEAGVRVRLETTVESLRHDDRRIVAAELAGGEALAAACFVSSIPTELYLRLVPEDLTPHLAEVRYTALLSAVCATRQKIEPDFYWMNLAALRSSACGIFVLSSLNPTIGEPGDVCVNFVTHLGSRERPLFRSSDAELLTLYAADFREIFGFELEPFWTHVARVPMYAPVFRRGYRNPPLRSTRWENLYFAGNYRTFPSIVSTGTALESGLAAAEAVLADRGRSTPLLAAARGFELGSMPRG